jgi:AcrR family transcriptional regulator
MVADDAKTLPAQPADHRSRVAAARRERMRARLIESALLVFTRHDIEAGAIDKVIKAAGVSRGTFYNYFRTNEELFVAVATEVSNELLRIVDPIVQQEADPAARVACGIRLVIELARNNPILAEFLVRGGPSALRYGSLVTEVVPRDLELGMASGRFSVGDMRLAFDLLLGPVNLAFHTVLTENVSKDYASSLAQGVLQSLGVARAEARRLCARPIGEALIPANSLFFRAKSRELH